MKTMISSALLSIAMVMVIVEAVPVSRPKNSLVYRPYHLQPHRPQYRRARIAYNLFSNSIESNSLASDSIELHSYERYHRAKRQTPTSVETTEDLSHEFPDVPSAETVEETNDIIPNPPAATSVEDPYSVESQEIFVPHPPRVSAETVEDHDSAESVEFGRFKRQAQGTSATNANPPPSNIGGPFTSIEDNSPEDDFGNVPTTGNQGRPFRVESVETFSTEIDASDEAGLPAAPPAPGNFSPPAAATP